MPVTSRRPPSDHPRLRRLPEAPARRRFVPAVIWPGVAVKASDKASDQSIHNLLLVFYGWVIGWISATIARVVYPPPKSSRRRFGGQM